MPEQNIGEKVVSDLRKDFRVVGSHRVHSWYAWAIVGIVFGMAVAIIYVSNRNAEFVSSQAAMQPKGFFEEVAMIGPLNPELSETNVGQIIQEYSQQNELKEASIEYADLVEDRDNKEVLVFREATRFNFFNPASWQDFQNVVGNALNGQKPFELTLNSQLNNSDQILVVGNNLSSIYNNYFALASGPKGRGGINYDPRCYCNATIKFTVTCTTNSGWEMNLVGPEPAGPGTGGVVDKDRKPITTGPVNTPEDDPDGGLPATEFSSSFKGKTTFCSDPEGKSVCSIEKCEEMAYPSLPGDPQGWYATHCKINYTSVDDGKDSGSGKCQDVIKASKK